MKKKPYDKPSVEVVALKQRQQLLAGSSGASVEDYTWHEITEESRPMDDDFSLDMDSMEEFEEEY